MKKKVRCPWCEKDMRHEVIDEKLYAICDDCEINFRDYGVDYRQIGDRNE